MTLQKIELSGAKQTLLYTLYFRAMDHWSRTPILDDHWAADILASFHYDRGQLRRKASDAYGVLLRARRLDDWTREFLASHPDTIVLHLGCGLDSRAFRLDIPDGVRWFDIDYPEVIELRHRVYPEREGYRAIGSSVTDLAWLDEIPTEAPVLVVAEGLLMYLAEQDVRRLLDALTSRFDHGELLFDVLAPWTTRLSGLFGWAPRDARELERDHAGLELVEQLPVSADLERLPSRGYRAVFRVVDGIPPLRDMMRLLHYRFPRTADHRGDRRQGAGAQGPDAG